MDRTQCFAHFWSANGRSKQIPTENTTLITTEGETLGVCTPGRLSLWPCQRRAFLGNYDPSPPSLFKKEYLLNVFPCGFLCSNLNNWGVGTTLGSSDIAFNPGTQEAEAGKMLSSSPAPGLCSWVPGQLGLHRHTDTHPTRKERRKEEKGSKETVSK